jgi:hypothetical protein
MAQTSEILVHVPIFLLCNYANLLSNVRFLKCSISGSEFGSLDINFIVFHSRSLEVIIHFYFSLQLFPHGLTWFVATAG